jgi:soluble lytic murein transglycosylase-like protein
MKIAIKVLLVSLAFVSMATQADAQLFKKGKKLSPKVQLVVERQRTDSLASLIEEYRRRENDLKQALAEQSKEEVYTPTHLMAVEYSPAQADSLAEQLKLEQVNNAFQNFFDNYIVEPETLSTDAEMDSLYAARLKVLVSPIHLPYNELVRSYIKRYTDSSGLMSRVLSLAQYYFPMIEEELIKAELPVELRAMAIIESALQATAVSRVGASGMWQFMPATAREYGLEVNNDIDERYNIEKATVAACRYLHDAYEKYGSWVDAAVSYNAGLQRVARERERQGVKSSLDMHLVDETSRYVFRILATKLLFENPAKYGFKIKAKQLYQPIATKTIEVTSTIDDLATWAQKQGITYKQLKDFNPWMLTQTLPDKSGKLYKIAIPIKEDMYYNAKRKYVTYNKNWVVD